MSDYNEIAGLVRYGVKAKAVYMLAFVLGSVCGTLLALAFVCAGRPVFVQVGLLLGDIRSSAGVAVFVSSQNNKAAWIKVGRAYQRFALQATALNIRTALINQPIEVRQLRPQLESWLKLDGEHAQLIVRFGHGPTAPFSLRRPIDDLIMADRTATASASH